MPEKKQSKRQQEYHGRKREARHLTATISASSTTKGGLRKTEGARRRRANTAKLKNENEKLLNEVQKLRKENLEMKKLLSQQQTDGSDRSNATPPRSPSKLFIDNTVLDGATLDITALVTDEIRTKDFQDNLASLKNEKFNLSYCKWQKQKNDKSNVLVSTKVILTLSIVDFVTKFMGEINVSP
ncbi:unnamed protein product [Didymodactylos carnosus]|uniref:Uncharacterized protein n=1 Tax=Didymodactylos carnosus TaxID=1234261 RepID=A0A8S2HKB5_9BILA|nr:unnamed protein product [Didymodactylos carnosus]CAF3651806.1 unnamed protein product [Didymodactylos carnosus]